MKAEISFDLVTEDDMDFVEGTYRLSGGEWRVFVFTRDPSVCIQEVRAARRASGATSVIVTWPDARVLNRAMMTDVLGEHLGVTEWVEVSGPRAAN